jgi:hypothetical protein
MPDPTCGPWGDDAADHAKDGALEKLEPREPFDRAVLVATGYGFSRAYAESNEESV